MRLWTVHPCYLDAKGLVAAWREGLLAQKVLAGGTRGYTAHPQLVRIRAHRRPAEAVSAFLAGIAAEADKRGYRFNMAKIAMPNAAVQIEETRGQLLYEWQHLLAKLEARAPDVHRQFKDLAHPKPHPMFRIVPGDIRDWERQVGSHSRQRGRVQ
jgi:hypothetical protein